LDAYYVHIHEEKERSEHMETVKKISKAVETYDHLLWQAIINVCGIGLSRSFHQEGNNVRVVYTTYYPDPEIQTKPFTDPQEKFSLIEKEVQRYISLSLPIRKIKLEQCRGMEEEDLCSSFSYRDFLLSKTMGDINLLIGLPGSKLEFVEMGSRGENDYICCPCVGQHLENTRDLALFEIKLQEPEK